MAKYLVSIDEETGEETGRVNVTGMRDTSFDLVVIEYVDDALDKVFERIYYDVLSRPANVEDVAEAINYFYGSDMAYLWREWVQED